MQKVLSDLAIVLSSMDDKTASVFVRHFHDDTMKAFMDEAKTDRWYDDHTWMSTIREVYARRREIEEDERREKEFRDILRKLSHVDLLSRKRDVLANPDNYLKFARRMIEREIEEMQE